MSELATQETGVTIDEQIGQALKRMPVTDAMIKALGVKYLPLRTKGADDKEGYEAVHSALMAVVKVRTSIEASRKILKADALKFGRAVDGEAERLTNLVLPLEEHLGKERAKVDVELSRIKALKDAAEQERYQGRAFKLAQLGMSFDGNIYKRGDIVIPAIILKTMDDSKFAGELAKVKADYDLEQDRIAEEARLKKEEEDRLAAEKVEAEKKDQERRAEEDRLRKIEDARLAADRAEIEKIRKEQAAKEAVIKAAQDTLYADKRAIEDQRRKEEEAKRHAEEIAKAKVEAAAQAIKDEQRRTDIEAKEKIERDRLTAIEAEEKKAQMTDKEKLKALLVVIQGIDVTGFGFKSKKAILVKMKVETCLSDACGYIKEGI